MPVKDIEQSRNNFIVSISSWHATKAAERVMEENNGLMVRAVSVYKGQIAAEEKSDEQKK